MRDHKLYQLEIPLELDARITEMAHNRDIKKRPFVVKLLKDKVKEEEIRSQVAKPDEIGNHEGDQ